MSTPKVHPNRRWCPSCGCRIYYGYIPEWGACAECRGRGEDPTQGWPDDPFDDVGYVTLLEEFQQRGIV